jgi:hypothetical protein
MRRLLLTLALVATVGCEAESQPVPAAANALVGPWQPVPFPLPGPILQAIDRACRGSMPDFPQQVQLTVVDARGGGRIQAHYSGPMGAEATCMDMSVDAAGRVEALGGGGMGFGAQAPPPLEANELTNGGAMSSDRSSIVYGRAGQGIAKVVILIPGNAPITASLANGWYLAWWPGQWPPGTKAVGFDVLGQNVGDTAVP